MRLVSLYAKLMNGEVVKKDEEAAADLMFKYSFCILQFNYYYQTYLDFLPDNNVSVVLLPSHQCPLL